MHAERKQRPVKELLKLEMLYSIRLSSLRMRLKTTLVLKKFSEKLMKRLEEPAERWKFSLNAYL